MPTGRVRGLRESPALVSAGPPTALTTTRGKDIDDGRTAAPGVRHPGGTSRFRYGSLDRYTGKFREPAFTPVSERRRSGESDGPRVRLAASNRQRYVTVETCFVTIGWGDGEAIGRRKIVVEGSDRARAGPGLGGVGASDVAGVLAGRPDTWPNLAVAV